jgi:hypothetical protein
MTNNEFCMRFDRNARMRAAVKVFRAAHYLDSLDRCNIVGDCQARRVLLGLGTELAELVWTDTDRAAEIANDVAKLLK